MSGIERVLGVTCRYIRTVVVDLKYFILTLGHLAAIVWRQLQRMLIVIVVAGVIAEVGNFPGYF